MADTVIASNDKTSTSTGAASGGGEQGMKDRLSNAANQVSQKASQVSDKVSSVAGQVGDRVSTAAHGAMESARGMVQDQPITGPRPEHREGVVARTLEMQTARIPSDAWLWAAFGSIGLSLAFELSGREKTANFIGHWAPTFLIFGLYNKMVKLQGSDGQ